MTFIQNPNYQSAHNNYKRIKELTSIDDELISSMIKFREIGLLDLPTIYERWCLLQIIKVIIDVYHFEPENNWKQKLNKQVSYFKSNKDIRDISINFTNNNLEREIVLSIEKELVNKKRPDFVLDIKSTFNDNIRTHRLVLDAKFHEKANIENLIRSLYKDKNYSEDNQNSVFILHPDKQAIKNRISSIACEKHSYYGELKMFDFEKDINKCDIKRTFNHKYGAIYFSIVNESCCLDNLQRLIGMVMQYTIEDNRNLKDKSAKNNNKIDPWPEEKFFCLVCASSDNEKFKKEQKTTEYGSSYKITCECGHYTQYNYCWNCKNRLIKNGKDWSYHSSQVSEPYNIKCPYCEEICV